MTDRDKLAKKWKEAERDMRRNYLGQVPEPIMRLMHIAADCLSDAASALSAQQPVASVERWRGLVEQLAQRFKGYLPWPDELRDSVVRGHEMFIEDTIKKADALLNASPPPAQRGPTPPAD